jgi:hypothetical protein
MSCPHCQGAEKIFDSETAQRDLKNYRSQGPGKTTRLLIDAIKRNEIKGLTLLDVGGGVGAIENELLNAGVTHATDVEASPAYLQVAKQEAARQGHSERITYYQGDFIALAPQLSQADIVTLEKVICCYPDMRTLVGLSSARAGKLYGIVIPLDTWWMKSGGRIINFIFRLQRNPFRFFVHATQEIDQVVRANGFERRFYRKTIPWQVILYARQT